MSDTRSWWPEGYGDDPAFQVRRQVYGAVTGGDYTRGSSVVTLAHTALRYPTEVAGAAEALNRAILHVRVKDHGIFKQPILDSDGVWTGDRDIPIGTVEITWGWPSSIEDTWREVALVRSAFGRPSTVNDGETIMIGPRSAFYKKDQAGKDVLDEDGNPVLITPPIVEDQRLPPGRWYHYGLFFKISEVEWIQGMVDSCLLPRDFHHEDHLWNNIPPYYRWTDDNYRPNDGFLRQFLRVFGFELDTAREFIEQWQHVYDADWSPIRLLRKLGDNFGYPYEQGIGDIRYRSLFAEIGRFYEIRGTTTCLEGVIRRMSKYNTTVTPGANLMLLPDDSDFTTGLGNWGGPHPSVDAPGNPIAYDRTFLAKAPPEITPPTGVGRGVMAVRSLKSDVGNDMAVACGANYALIESAYVEVVPRTSGIPVNAGLSYGFSVWIKAVKPSVALQLSLLWFDKTGLPDGFISASSGAVASVATTNWTQVDINTMYQPPDDAVYVVPYILFDVRTDDAAFPTYTPEVYVAGVMVYAIETIGEALGPPPNQYLTISDPGEPLGGPLTFKGNLTGAGTPLPTGAAVGDAYTLMAPIPTASPQFLGVTPARNAQASDAIYWNGTAWINIGTTPSTFEPFLLGSPEGAP